MLVYATNWIKYLQFIVDFNYMWIKKRRALRTTLNKQSGRQFDMPALDDKTLNWKKIRVEGKGLEHLF